jgi:peptide/nickel transport system substrate-binding protein
MSRIADPFLFRQLLCAVAASAALCTQALAAPPQRGGTLTLIGAEPPALVSLANITVGTRDISGKVTEGLLTFDDQFKPKPLLATQWSVSADGKRYTFQLRPGVKWHDGQPFTSADVAYSIQELKRANARGRTTFAHVERVETPDASTAVIVLSAPAPYLLRALSAAESPIVPKHVYDKGEAAATQNASAPVGTGPFRFKQWVRGSHAEFERNPDYWDSGKPYLDRLIYRFSADPAAIAAALETGAADFSTSVSLTDVARLQKHARLQAEAQPSAYLNNIAAIEFNLKNEFFSNPQVRKAVAHAIDQNLLNRIAYQQYAQPLGSPIPPTMAPFHDPGLRAYKHDVAAANALLDAAGFKRGPDGKRFSATIDYFPTPTLKQVAEYVKAALSRVGIHLTVRSQDLGVFVQRVYTRREFDLEVNGVGTLFDPTVGVQRLYASKDAGKGIPFVNAAGYQNAEVDETKRVAQFKRLQAIVMDELPLLPLVAVPRGNVWNRRVHGLFTGVEGSAGSLADAWVEAPRP